MRHDGIATIHQMALDSLVVLIFNNTLSLPSGTVVPMETNDTASDSAFSSAGGMSVTELSSVGSPTPVSVWCENTGKVVVAGIYKNLIL